MNDVKKIYQDVPAQSLGQFLDDLKADFRDVPNSDWDTVKQPDGNYTVEVTIKPTTDKRVLYSGRYS